MRAKNLLLAAAFFFGTSAMRVAAADAFSVTVTGAGRPMILIPGLASGGNVWDGTVARFKDHYQCHVLTLAGFAGQPPIEAPVLSKVRDGIVKYIEEKKLDHPIIIGHSLGGMMSFWVAEAAPNKVGPVISVDGLPFLPAAMDPTATADSARPQAEQFQSMYTNLTTEQYKENNHQFLSMMITSPTNVDKVASLGDKSDPKAVGQAAFELFTTDLRPDLKSITAPVLLIGSTSMAPNDDAKGGIEKAYADQIASIPKRKVVFAPNARHFIQLDDPDFFYTQVEAFLKENQK